jgi:CheY-like chemotaxis protein
MSNLRILVVENDHASAFLAGLQLEHLGHPAPRIVHTLSDASSCIDERPRPELVLLDVQLDMGQLSAPLATALSERGIPFIVVTGRDKSALPAAYAAGIHLLKPYDMSELIEAIGRALGDRQR